MEHTPIQSAFRSACPALAVKCNEPFSKHTSFRIGGPAEVMVFPRNLQELSVVLAFCSSRGYQPHILGAGTNVLAPDEGLAGITLCLKDCLDGITQTGPDTLEVMAGVTMARLAVFAQQNGLSGLEFAHGIPGTVGGGIYMNAGAYGGEIAGICRKVWVMDAQGNLHTRSAEQMQFSYRHSVLMEQPGIVVKAEFCLVPGDASDIYSQMQQFREKRLASQPLDLPSAGSAFKRPKTGYAAALIDGAGLKGFRIGDAAISEKHAGFAVNMGNATAEEVRQLLQETAKIVLEKSGVLLEPEIRFW